MVSGQLRSTRNNRFRGTRKQLAGKIVAAHVGGAADQVGGLYRIRWTGSPPAGADNLGEGLDLIAEAFNLFNTVNYDVNTVDNAEFLLDLSGGAPGYVPNPRFGEYLDTLQPFEIQLGVRWRF